MRNVFPPPSHGPLWANEPKRLPNWVELIRNYPFGVVGLLVLVIIFVASGLAHWIAPYDPLETNYANTLAAPSLQHWLGTDTFGRDLLSRVLYGGRTALFIGVSASIIGSTIGAMLGITSAYIGGWFELILERFLEVLLAIPTMILALVLVATMGRNLVFGIDFNLVLAIALPIVPNMARIARSQTLTIRRQAYVDAARTLGFSSSRIIAWHIAPNIAGPYIVMVTTFVSQAILIEASLSYLGLGVTAPTASWGLMLAGNAFNSALTAPWIVIFPGVAIALVVFSFSMLGDALRDIFDPKASAGR
ncbi:MULTISPECIES: ABC transporter permease [Chelativorans]|jgi:peptide/nickel transport system permease protein|uniref:Binding-protein-dependent transport systems inner membrane component n=1 Tax=Chelativorans sp. (strain BNC1) TaxID=266779 RepID=Q11BX8_CHESB|nr:MULTISPECIES: ABC transporter permease [Chelativorans]